MNLNQEMSLCQGRVCRGEGTAGAQVGQFGASGWCACGVSAEQTWKVVMPWWALHPMPKMRCFSLQATRSHRTAWLRKVNSRRVCPRGVPEGLWKAIG